MCIEGHGAVGAGFERCATRTSWVFRICDLRLSFCVCHPFIYKWRWDLRCLPDEQVGMCFLMVYTRVRRLSDVQQDIPLLLSS